MKWWVTLGLFGLGLSLLGIGAMVVMPGTGVGGSILGAAYVAGFFAGALMEQDK